MTPARATATAAEEAFATGDDSALAAAYQDLGSLVYSIAMRSLGDPEDARFQRDREEPDDFRHRMLANVAALAFTVALTAIGIWLAMSIADLRKTQDCVLMGRRDCAQISTPRGMNLFGS